MPGARVVIVDDDPAVRRSLARLVATAGYQVEAVGSAAEFLARPAAAEPCCLVLDVRLPGLTGPELQQALAAQGRPLAVVFLSAHGDVSTSVRAMKDGAIDFLTKPVPAAELLGAIERAVQTARDAHRRRSERAALQARLGALSPRESQVLTLVVTGLLNKQIAGRLGIGEKTVKVHRARVMRKMQAGSLAELVRLAAGAGVPARSG
jgi:FixJ family two-component response regulator